MSFDAIRENEILAKISDFPVLHVHAKLQGDLYQGSLLNYQDYLDSWKLEFNKFWDWNSQSSDKSAFAQAFLCHCCPQIPYAKFHIKYPLTFTIILNYITVYTTLTNFSTKYLMMCKVYTDVGGIK